MASHVGRTLVLAGWLATLVACDSDVAGSKSDEGHFSVARVIVEDRFYSQSSGMSVLEVPLERGVLFWESPFSDDLLFNVLVEIRIGSTDRSVAYVPVANWLESMGADTTEVKLVRIGSRTARTVSILDKDRLLRGFTLTIATPRPNVTSKHLEMTRAEVSDREYIELQRPTFTSAFQFPNRFVYWAGGWDDDFKGGTFVAAWVEEIVRGDTVRTPVTTWLREEDRWNPSNLYPIQVAERLFIRDRNFALVGKTIVVAHTSPD